MTRLAPMAAAVVLACIACLERADVPQAEDEQMMGRVAPAEAPSFAPARKTTMMLQEEAPASPAPLRQQQAPIVTDKRKIIRHGDLRLEVPSVDEAFARIKELVDAVGGYVTNESVSQDEYSTKSGSITCRIPAEELDPTLEELKGLGKVDYVAINADDITEQYFDLEVRTRNQKELERRLMDLLKRRTNKLSDLLAVERELARVRTESDSREGRKRLWDNQIALSTVVVNVREPGPAIAKREGGVFRTLLRSFRRAGENFVLTIAQVIAVSGALIPLAALALVGIWGGRKIWRRRKKASV